MPPIIQTGVNIVTRCFGSWVEEAPHLMSLLADWGGVEEEVGGGR